MRAKPLPILVLVVLFVGTGFAQTPPVLGNVSVVPGAGATLKVTLSFVSSSRLRFSTNGSALPPGVSMTSTYLEPGSNRLSLHFEAATGAGLTANRSVDIYAGNFFVPVYQVMLSVVAGTAQTCGSASVNPLDQSSQAVVASGATPGCNVEVWAGDSGGL